MWDIYQRDGRGVAVRSTWDRLTSSLSDPHEIFGGLVKYVNYASDPFPDDNWITPYMHKRKSFEHEKEARLMLIDPHGFNAVSFEGSRQLGFGEFDDGEPPATHSVSVELTMLVEAIYVAPGTPEWQSNLVQRLAGRYLKECTFEHSSLDDAPIF
ncbi:DUF2971 domain-containing protein [Leifsonia sp. NPDC056665]|uniref:DUF2971 domain-containing protein n=1 Tax=Leifsonia sp. NPDC056665 TaxID=3345901 RepID=UPI003696F189